MAKDKKRKGPEGLDRSHSHLLHRALQRALDLYAEEAGADAPSQRQFAVLSACAERPGLTQTDLVAATGIDRSTLAELVSRMKARGLVLQERSASDARAKTVTLTAEGLAALESLKPRAAAADRRILEALPRGKREGFLRLLALVCEPAEAKPEKAAKPKKKKAKAAKVALKADAA
ncbi:MarR family winged helix-turn-helix transcriptional regulator [Brevundimonas sp. 2R-24]|uniref:MarR family winged helix-turn-helix transcriptional regulator n=1 Tax=Peiella sedimenti TaxID=3061083 RepID=A0ABT8SNU5_9CAUL|nr:MarR family winged helix-turn-helix transcriptional regulator [Caulobacteraceae bacterium XZ-24]